MERSLLRKRTGLRELKRRGLFVFERRARNDPPSLFVGAVPPPARAGRPAGFDLAGPKRRREDV